MKIIQSWNFGDLIKQTKKKKKRKKESKPDKNWRQEFQLIDMPAKKCKFQDGRVIETSFNLIFITNYFVSIFYMRIVFNVCGLI